MGLKGCQITLDNPWNTYYAGQTVNGKVVFTFDSPKKIRGKKLDSVFGNLSSIKRTNGFKFLLYSLCRIKIVQN